MLASSSAIPVLTQSQARQAEIKFQRLVTELEQGRALRGEPAATPVDYWIYQGLFAAAYGAEVVSVIPDP